MSSLVDCLQSLGPQVFETSGDLSLWLAIIGTSDAESVNRLIKLIEDKTASQKHDLAKHILADGWQQVYRPLEDNNNDDNDAVDVGIDVDDSVSVPEQAPMVTSDSNSLDMTCDQDLSEQKINTTQEEEPIEKGDEIEDAVEAEDVNNYEIDDSSGSYSEVLANHLENPLTPMSQESYESCERHSPQITPKPVKDIYYANSLSMNMMSNVYQSKSFSTPNVVSKPNEERFNAPVLTLSPIASVFSQNKQNISPTISLNVSSTSSYSPKSSLSSNKSPSKRSSMKASEKTIEEYKSLIPYESYCSEQKFFGSPTNQSIISDILFDNITEENEKYLDSVTNV